MPWRDDWDFGASEDPDRRREHVARQLARLPTTPPPESDARKAKERLAKHDLRWGLSGWGSALRIGDPEGDADVS